jgi:hypothetical protein
MARIDADTRADVALLLVSICPAALRASFNRQRFGGHREEELISGLEP